MDSWCVWGGTLVSPLVIEENGAFPFKTHLTMETEIDMQKFTAKIVDMMKREKLYASQGGPIILSQLWHLHRLGYGIELKSTIRNWGKLTDWLNVASFNGVAVVQNYLDRMGREEWAKQEELKWNAKLLKLYIGREKEMQKFTAKIVDMMKQEKLYASQGGPIIISQIQNEYGNVNSAYGAVVKPYIKWPASMATSLDTRVPWVMCQRSMPMIQDSEFIFFGSMFVFDESMLRLVEEQQQSCCSLQQLLLLLEPKEDPRAVHKRCPRSFLAMEGPSRTMERKGSWLCTRQSKEDQSGAVCPEEQGTTLPSLGRT
ncbi:hypothetical protein Syun_020858 [Stephania yunnanensis]|uniref:beta-galactosidase n=1 Tax=Stephania yunnanensis TaxID=152371 RepID=A0AAP0IFX2_9MAGN